MIITGSEGFIGKEFTGNFLGLDVKNGYDVSKKMPKAKHDVVVHLAAYMKDEPDLWENNIDSTQRVVDYCQKHNAHLIFASSAAVYGNAGVFPTPEDHELDPINNYGSSKSYCEELARMVPKHTIFRFGNVFPKPDSCWGKLKESNTIYGDGEQIRDFINVDDVVGAIEDAEIMDIYGTFNLSSGRGMTINEFYERYIGGTPEYIENPNEEIRNSILDNTKWIEASE